MNSLRIISYNLFKGRLWWSGRSAFQSMASAIRAQSPDLVFLQEFRGSDGKSKELHENFQKKLDLPYGYYGKNYSSASSDHGNAIYSRPALIQSANTDLTISKRERRGLLASECRPWGDDTDLFLFCTHLDLSEDNRKKQLDLLCTQIESILPHKDTAFILAGDFNDWRRTADQYLQERLGVYEAFRKSSGGLARSFPSFYPLLELDRVYVRGVEVRKTQILAEKFRMLSDHLPLLVEIERV